MCLAALQNNTSLSSSSTQPPSPLRSGQNCGRGRLSLAPPRAEMRDERDMEEKGVRDGEERGERKERGKSEESEQQNSLTSMRVGTKIVKG